MVRSLRPAGVAFAIATILGVAACGARSSDASSIHDETGTDEATQDYSIINAGKPVGRLRVVSAAGEMSIDYDYKNNGRGPTISERITLGTNGVPIAWSVDGSTTFGNEVTETFSLADGVAAWEDTAGGGEARVDAPSLYVAQHGTPFGVGVLAHALLGDDDRTMPALPAGRLSLSEIDRLDVTGTGGGESIVTYALSGADLDPDYVALDERGEFFAYLTPRLVVVRAGFESEEKRLRDLAARYGAERFEAIQARVAHVYAKPIRIRNVRVFDPETLSLTTPASVVVDGDTIFAIESTDVPTKDGEVEIDGAGGTLVPGLYDMHAHLGDDDALLNVLAGITSVRDMGNEIDVLEPLRDKIESGVLAGPRIAMSGFIEGESETNNSTGELATTEEEAVALVDMYADRGDYHQIKVYSSVKGEWVGAMADAAHARGMRITGHVPAFSTVDQMIEAGYDEVTHINQVMLSWVLPPDADTRTLQRITGMKAFANLDLESEKVQHTIDLMADRGVAVDPTTVIHEFGLLSRNGTTHVGFEDYIDHMPVAVQRQSRVALLNVASAEDDDAYKKAFDKIIDTLAMMKGRGIFIVPGTDMGGAFQLHREVELFQEFGFTPAEALRRATYDMAGYLGFKDRGRIAPGMLADFFMTPGDPTTDLKAIKTISLISRGGTIYFPSEVYPEFGITPFTEIPAVKGAE